MIHHREVFQLAAARATEYSFIYRGDRFCAFVHNGAQIRIPFDHFDVHFHRIDNDEWHFVDTVLLSIKHRGHILDREAREVLSARLVIPLALNDEATNETFGTQLLAVLWRWIDQWREENPETMTVPRGNRLARLA